jgi:hypothetical protein
MREGPIEPAALGMTGVGQDVSGSIRVHGENGGSNGSNNNPA